MGNAESYDNTSTAAGDAGYPVGQSYDNDHGTCMIDLDVRTLSGEEFRLRVESSTRGSEVRKMVLDHLPVKSGAKLVLDHMKHQTSEQMEETVRLKLHQTLQEQGLAEAETAILCCTYVPTQLQAAWCFLMGFTSEAELSLEGVTHLTTPSVGLLHSTSSQKPCQFDNWRLFQPELLQPELGTRELAWPSAEFDFWKSIQPEFGTRGLAWQSLKFDFWSCIRTEFGTCDLAQQFAEFDFWWCLQPEFGTCDLAQQSAEFDFWICLQQEFGTRDLP